jgi:hypothetical protein
MPSQPPESRGRNIAALVIGLGLGLLTVAGLLYFVGKWLRAVMIGQ